MSIPNHQLQVLMLGWELPPYNSGGLGVACYGLTRGLSRFGTKIAFALPRRLSSSIPFLEILSHDLQGVEITAINSLLQSYMNESNYFDYATEWRKEKMNMYGLSLYEEAHRFADMATAWSRQKPHHLLHAHDWMTYPAAMRATYVSGKPWVAHVHATEYDRTGGNLDPRIADIEYKGLNKANRVIAVSQYTKKTIQDYYGVPGDKIEVVYNGLDQLEFTPADIRRVFPHDNIILFVGRLTFQKGVEYFLKAAKKVLETHPNTVFLVVGHGDMYQKLLMESAYLGIAKRVIFVGFLTGEKLRAVYSMADAFVMPSVSEPYGLVALEALATGTPAIISKQSGVAETLSHVYKVDFWDIDKMARQITTIIDYPDLAKEMAQLAKREASCMTWEKAAQKTLSVYQSLV